MLCFDDGGRGHKPRNAKNTAPEAREGQQEASEGSMSCPHLEHKQGLLLREIRTVELGEQSHCGAGQRQTQQVHTTAWIHTGPWLYGQMVLLTLLKEGTRTTAAPTLPPAPSVTLPL